MKVIFTACLAIGFFLCHSQNKFIQEFIVLQNGDTLNGTVSISSQNFKEVKFSDASGNTRDYSPSEISNFFDKEWGLFTSLKVSLYLEDSKSEAVQTAPLPLFFEKVSEVNQISLYYFKNGKYGEHYFLQKNSSAPVELLNSERRTVIAGKESTYRDQAYKKTLIENLNDCNAIEQTISATKLSKKSLHDLFAKYSECFSKPTYQSTLDKGEWSWGIVAGGFSSSIKYESKVDNNKPNNFENNAGFTAGLMAHYLISKKSKRFTVIGELMYRRLETSFSIVPPPYIASREFSFQLDYLRLNTLIQYSVLPAAAVKPFFQLGISNSFAVAHKTQIDNKTNYPVRTYEQGVILGIGANYKKFSLSCRYEFSNGFLVPNNEEEIAVGTFSVGVGYFFKKKL